jgi:hypothetical protein
VFFHVWWQAPICFPQFLQQLFSRLNIVHVGSTWFWTVLPFVFTEIPVRS